MPFIPQFSQLQQIRAEKTGCEYSNGNRLLTTSLIKLAVQQGKNAKNKGNQNQRSYSTICRRRMDGWLGFNGILSMQVAAISCLKKLSLLVRPIACTKEIMRLG